MPAICSGERPASEPVNCVGEDGLGPVAEPLVLGLADADDRDQPGGQGGVELGVDLRVGLAQPVPPLAVAEDHVGAAGVDEHRAGDLAGVRPAGLPVHVLAAQADRRAFQDRVDRLEEHRRRADDDMDVGRRADARLDRLGQGDAPRTARRIHLPVAGDQQGAHETGTPSAGVDRLAEQLGELPELVHQPVELVGHEGLRPVGEGLLGAAMDLDVDRRRRPRRPPPGPSPGSGRAGRSRGWGRR